jgi:predicted acylesterase/phospholipase RssA
MYVRGDDFASVFSREMEAWVKPASAVRPGRKKALEGAQRPDQAHDLVGLALSGGGIRSATFSLGVCQAMARYGVMERVDYLSTVSGGGYFGSAISSLLSHNPPAKGEQPLSRGNFPFRFNPTAASPEEIRGFKAERRTVRHLREHSNYLAPRLGLFGVDIWRAVLGIAVRLVLSLALIVLPVALLLLSALALVPAGAWNRGSPLLTPGVLVAPGAVGVAALLFFVILNPLRPPTRYPKRLDQVQGWCIRVMVVSVLFLGFVFGVQGALMAGDILVASFGGGGGALLLFARWAFTRVGDIEKRTEHAQKGRLAALVRPALFNILGYLVLAVGLVLGFLLLDGLDPAVKLVLAAGALVYMTAVELSKRLLGWMNVLSLLPLYRWGLSEAYILREEGRDGDARVTGNADIALAQLQSEGRSEGRPVGPRHILGTSLNISGSSDLSELGRRSDSFFLSCLHSGSSGTGFVDTEHRYPTLSLATAMAISGAAVSPNMGSYTSTSTANLMTLLNARLGYWAKSPALDATDPRDRASKMPLKWVYYLREMFGAASGKHRYVYLTDGGHFDNSAIYELIRRRCRFIIAVDGAGEASTTDPDFNVIGTASRLARIDFGVEIQMSLKGLIPDEQGRTAAHFAVGRIVYPKVKRPGWTDAQVEADRYGTLVYIKASVSDDNEAPDLESYRRLNPVFPVHSTADAFFDEPQFEAYRALGYHIGRETFRGRFVREDGTLAPDEEAFQGLGQGHGP